MPLNAEDTAGRFRVWLFLEGKPPVLVWDRKVEGGFPELKVLVSPHGRYVYDSLLMNVLNAETTHPRSHPTRQVPWAF